MAKAKPPIAPFVARTAPGRLAGKIALVTGAAGNIGGYIVRHYLAEGATVVMTGRTSERLEAAAIVMREASGVDASRLGTVVLDGGDPQSVRDGIADVVRRFGKIDILVNNAGSAGPKQTIEQLPFDADELASLQKK
jgi:malonyl-CoA reductase/3-hydroxypropionate dehydrogenase (NADP+)